MRKITTGFLLIVCQLAGSAQNNTGYSSVSDEFLSTVLMTHDEKKLEAEWMKQSFGSEMPFSFVYHSKKSVDLLKHW
ncbi:MAG TPA: hypothetical protein VFC34_17245, partial [Puia sp.]|nr:hypothetical protein [Puia sp.]